MRRPDTTKRAVRHFSVLIVPHNRSSIRRLEISLRTVRFVIGGAVVFAVFLCTLLTSFLFYRHAYNVSSAIRLEGAQYIRERAALLGRLDEMEDTLSRTERFIAKIGSALDRKPGKVAGKGPVDETEWLPAPEDAASLSTSYRLGSGIWKSPFAKTFTAGLNLTIDSLTTRAEELEDRAHALFALQQDRLSFWASLPSIWPSQGWVTSEFGSGRGWGGHRRRFHEGIDIASPRGTPVFAPGDGVITYTGYRGGYGNTLVIDHGYGVSTLYAHCSILYATEGQRVKRGMIIAAVGDTGRSSGPHLHYEVHVDGMPVDPMLYVMNTL